MKAEIMAAAIREDTSPTVYSLPSMKNLLLFISAAPGLPSLKRMPGTVGSHRYEFAQRFNNNHLSFTPVKKEPCKTICNLFKMCFKYALPNFPALWPGFDPVNTSSKYRDNAWPIPAGNAGPASCHRSGPGIASMEKYPALMPDGHSSIFPAALSCKALSAISYLL